MRISNIHLFLCLLICQGCSTLSNREKSFLTTTGAVIVAGAIGYATAPSGTTQAGHGALWAGAAGTVAGLANLFLYDSEAEIVGKSEENRKISLELKRYKDQSDPKTLFQSSVTPFASLPQHYKDLIDAGMLDGRELNQWVIVDGDPNHQIHQDVELILKVPTLNPKNINPNLWRNKSHENED